MAIQRHASGSYAKLASKCTETVSKKEGEASLASNGRSKSVTTLWRVPHIMARATVALKWAFQKCDVGEFIQTETGGSNLIH